ncbi:MAG: hypothetical protein P4L84_24455 [Isosphaeraceae bacterium]|nr:hypothetical protein [Isosphaeraceae bacterium]
MTFSCSQCGRPLKAKAQFAGKIVRCQACGGNTTVPAPNAEAEAGVAVRDRSARGGAVPQRGRGPAEARDRQEEVVESVLPRRSDLLAARARQVLEQPAEAAKADAPSQAAKPAQRERGQKKPKRKKRRSGGDLAGSEVARMILTVLAANIIAIPIVAMYPGLMAPIGGFFCLIGFLMTLVGTMELAKVAREKGAIYGLLCKFVPPYKLYFVFAHWKLLRDQAIIYVAGALLLYPGLILVRTSPAYKEMFAPSAESKKPKGPVPKAPKWKAV